MNRTKCRGRCFSGEGYIYWEAERGEVRKCEHGRLWICTRGANVYLFAQWHKIDFWLAPVLWFKVRRHLNRDA